jgi:hypothetical protein
MSFNPQTGQHAPQPRLRIQKKNRHGGRRYG